MKRWLCLIFILVFLPVAALADDPISGKWSFFWDTRVDHADESTGMIFVSIDLILLENHFAFLIMTHVSPDDRNFVLDDPIARGSWSPEGDNEYILRMGLTDPFHPMTLKEDGRLYLQMSEHAIYPFTKTQNYSMYSEAAP